MCFAIFSDVTKCCHCVTDLKTASAIIAVLALVTSPAVAWAIIRHSYVVRVSCYMTTNSDKSDVVDINFNNVVSFGFGANAGLSSSCFNLKTSNASNNLNNTLLPNYNNIVKWTGWTVLCSDLIFIIFSLIFLVHITKAEDLKINTVAKLFICSGTIATLVSFVYGMLYLFTCLNIGGKFPLFELFFTCVDLAVWTYFLMVVNSYRRKVVLAYDASTKISLHNTTV